MKLQEDLRAFIELLNGHRVELWGRPPQSGVVGRRVCVG